MAATNPVGGFQEKVCLVGSISIHYAEAPPSGPPLVLLHGLARDWRSFSVLLPELSRRFHVFAADLRGHGGSSHVKGAYRISQFAQDISEFISLLLPNGAAIFGHSLGAMVAMAVASENSRVKALIVGDSMITPEIFSHSLYTPLFLQLHRLLLRGESEEKLAAGIGNISIRVQGLDEPIRLEELPGNAPATILEWARCAIQTDPDALAMTVNGNSFEGWDPALILPRISCPTLLLQGNPELDALLSDEDVKLALKLLPHAEHVKFPLLGHALFMQQPKPVLREIVTFLSGLD